MIVRGKIYSVNPDKETANILCIRPSACSHSCEDCSSCQTTSVSITVKNLRSYKIGDIVEAEVNNTPPWAALFAVYLFPVVMLLLLCILTFYVETIAFKAILAVVGTILVFVVLKVINKAFRGRIQGEIINLIKSEKSA